jgi:integron integrase
MEKKTNIASCSHPPRLMDVVRQKLRVRHYSFRTERTYIHWIKRFILFHDKRHPREMGKTEVEAFLSSLALDRHVAAATQNLALSSILFLYRDVLEQELPWLDDVVRAKKPKRLPTVLGTTEIQRLFDHLEGTGGLIARLLYGSGMRLTEGLRLRVKDLDLERRQILVRDGKGAKDRATVFPDVLIEPMKAALLRRRALYEQDQAVGRASVWLPYALAEKYPNAATEWAWRGQSAGSHLSELMRSTASRRNGGMVSIRAFVGATRPERVVLGVISRKTCRSHRVAQRIEMLRQSPQALCTVSIRASRYSTRTGNSFRARRHGVVAPMRTCGPVRPERGSSDAAA